MNRSEQISVLEAFRKVLGQELHNLKEWPEILWQQMYNRLQWVDGEDGDGPVSKTIVPEFKKRTYPEAKPWFHQINPFRESECIIRTFKAHRDSVNSCSFSSDGEKIISGSKDGTLKLWDAETGKEITTLKGHTGSVGSCAFSPDGEKIVSGSYDKTLKLWDSEIGKEIATLQGHTYNVNSCAFSPDGKKIVSASDDKTLKLWDAEIGKEIATLQGHTGSVNSCAFSPDGKWIVSGSGHKTLILWDAETGKEITTLQGHIYNVNSCAFSPDGKQIVSGGGLPDIPSTLELFDTESGALIKTLKNAHRDSVNSCAFSPDGKKITSTSWDKTLKIWDAKSGDEITTLKGHTSRVYSCAFSPDGEKIISASMDGTLKLWAAKAGAKITTFLGHTKGVDSCALSPNGKKLISAGSEDNTMMLWDIETGKSMRDNVRGKIRSCAFSPDGKKIVLGKQIGLGLPMNIKTRTLELLDAESGDVINKLKVPYEVKSCAFSPDGKRIVSVVGSNTLLWDAESGEKIATLKSHKYAIKSCAFSPGGKKIVSASHNQPLSLWDAESGAEIKTFKVNTTTASSCAFSPDGEKIVSGGGYLDYTLKLWDAETGKEITTLEGHTGNVRSCAFFLDGKKIISGSEDGTLKLWDAVIGKELTLFPTLGACISLTISTKKLCCGDAGDNIYILRLCGFDISPSVKETLSEPSYISEDKTEIQKKPLKPQSAIATEEIAQTREELLSEADKVTHQITLLFEDLDFPPIKLKKEDKEAWKKTKRKKIEELQEKEQKIWKALEHVKSRQPGEIASNQKRGKMDLEKNAENNQYLKSIKTTNEHLRQGSAKGILPRLWEITEREEKNFFLFLESNLSEGKLNNSKPDDIGKLIMGTHNEPTAIRLLFEMLSSYPEEPPRLEAGKILFADISKLFVFMFEEQDKNTLTKFLKTGLTSDSFETRNACMWAIFKLAGNRAFEICSTVFLHHKPEVRLETARLYGFLRDKRATRGLIISLEMETYPKIRSTILWALGYIKDPGATRILIESLNDKEPEAAGYAAWALGEIGGPEAIKALTDAAIDKSKHAEVRDWAVRALIKTGVGKQTMTTENTSQNKISKNKPTNITCKCGQNNPITNKWCAKCGRELQ